MEMWCAEKTGANGKRSLMPQMGVGYTKTIVQFEVGRNMNFDDPVSGWVKAKDTGWSVVMVTIERIG